MQNASHQFGLFDAPPPAPVPSHIAKGKPMRRPSIYSIPALDLDPGGAARRSDPDTSKDAAAETRAQRLERIVLDALRKSEDGLTSEECAAVTQLSLVTVSPRMRPLVRKGKIYESKDRRLNPSGKKAIVWKVIPF
jgi:hypothetical protein